MTKARALALTMTMTFAALLAVASRGRADEPRVVDITAKRFEFSPATITVKKGEAVKLRVTSEDVTHGLFSRAFKIDSDLEPGQTREMTVTADKTGTFLVICHHFCGAQHGNMKLTVVVE